MKYRRKLFLSVAVLFALALLPVGARAETSVATEGLTASDVQCVVEPIYSFTVPPNAWLNYPDTRMTVGEFAIGELLLANGEALSVTLTPGALQTPDGDTLPYDVSFSPPPVFDESAIGEAYRVAIEIDAAALNSSPAGTYTASLLFCVVSHPANEAIWHEATAVAIVKPQAAESVDQEGVPSTGILASGIYLWYVAALAVIVCVAVALRAALIKAKRRRQDSHKDG